MKQIFLSLWISSLVLALSTQTRASDEGDDSVQTLLREHCSECHGADERSGGLSFEDRGSIFQEADSGQHPVVPGDVDASELIRRVTSASEDLRMPPEGERLSDDQIDVLRQWINGGAPWPGNAAPEKAPDAVPTHWSFEPLRQATPLEVQDPGWSRSPLDRFVQVERERAGLLVAPDAEPGVLLRRATYTLTGLPPTPEESAAFSLAVEADGLALAFSALVDQLLNRPSYGERWGRHWMDWVRYADTAGDNSDFPIPQAYLYRKYIIDAFNNDLPYDRFLIEQLAGDLLPAESQDQRNRQTIATGYLAMARRFGSLLERYPWHLTIEDTIDNVGRTMMGLTISCARCHDHKFDPISTRDYYGLYGFFASTKYPQPGLELFQCQHDLVPLVPNEQVAETLGPFQAETEKLEAELEKLLSACRERAQQNAAKEAEASLAEKRQHRDELDALLLKARQAGEKLAAHLKKIPPIPASYAVQEGTPQHAHVQIKGEPERPGAEVPRKFPDILGGHVLPSETAQSGSGRLELARWIASPDNPLTARVIVNRVWERHFGHGLVPTTSDFGLRGEVPTHPELLDWLAGEFIRSGWSIKHLHRIMLNSRTFGLSSIDLDANLVTDPSNRYLWKFNRQRLDAESIRDTLMQIAGSLDPAPQSEPYPIPPQSEWKYTQHHPYKDDYSSNKRSVYLMTKRLTATPYFQTFDGPDPNVCTSDRDQSVTPLQALYFVNDAFLHEQAARFAQSLLNQPASDAERAQLAFKTVLCRDPRPQEIELLLAHVAAARQNRSEDQQAEQQAWSSLTRSLMRLNEFLYID